jgi:hypothetical protein
MYYSNQSVFARSWLGWYYDADESGDRVEPIQSKRMMWKKFQSGWQSLYLDGEVGMVETKGRSGLWGQVKADCLLARRGLRAALRLILMEQAADGLSYIQQTGVG